MKNENILRSIKLTEARKRAAKRSFVDLDTLTAAEDILAKIKAGGDSAIKQFAVDFGESGKVYDQTDLLYALKNLNSGIKNLLERSMSRISAFAQAQRSAFSDVLVETNGAKLSHRLFPVERVGCYVPGGRYPLPSSLLMTALSAKAAGVEDIVICCPRPSDIILAAAALCGANCVIGLGGVQAVAAMSFGYNGVKSRDVITGPGNRWVSAAKQLLNGSIRMDLPAGPTELVVIADRFADIEFVAADLIAQAEHDTDAWPVLIAVKDFDLDKLNRVLSIQLSELSTSQTAREALTNGFCVLVNDLAEAAELTNDLAPEHLSVQVANAPDCAGLFTNYGTIFIGSMAAEALGDYGIGPNHVLPTGGAARRYGALSVLNFLRVQTRIDATDVDEQMLADASALAIIEGLEGHASAINIRRIERGLNG